MDPEKTVSIHPYFQVNEGKVEEFKLLLPKFIEKTKTEKDCLFYDFTINGSIIFCREAYVGGEAALHHLDNVGELLGKALEISELIRLEIHGSAIEIDKLRESLADLNPDWFVFDNGIEK
ncbi:MAG: hypothetical protein P1V20_23595 [Verrucomicrobiales bacterium]|nr:hypothetical protein [Verrucomicrobiales bacterium]